MRSRAREPIIHPMDATLAELTRLLQNLIRLGTIVEVDGDRARVASGKLTTDWLLWLTSRAGNAATWWQPSVGEQVLLLSPGGDLAAGVILPALYSDQHPAPSLDPAMRLTTYPDGASVSYNSATHTLDINLPAGTINIDAAAGVTINASDGNVNVNCDVIADGISLKDHVHGGVSPGGATTGAPQ